MVSVQIDGVWTQVPAGTKMIEACRLSGKFIPHYCYHPKLSTPGNCRMCLVESGMPARPGPDGKVPTDEDGHAVIQWSPRPVISCANEVVDGMGIRTDSQMVRDVRNGVMEFLLINHPLDCPICDQAGECKLQEYAVEFGKGGSRFLENKVKKPKNVRLGPRVILDDERCILCSRCIRFMREIAHDDCLGFVDRGGYSSLACHPGKPLTSNYSLNTVDICPVGALTSTDFRFQMRVWFLKETKSIDVNCGTGTNILIGSRENKIYRITPRENDYVNECWMPDSHRLNFHYVDSPERLVAPRVSGEDGPVDATWREALDAIALRLDKLTDRRAAVIASARMTNEEAFLAAKFAKLLGATELDVLPRPQEGDGFLISSDGNPNTTGARLMGTTKDPGARLPAIVEGIRSGAIKVLFLLGEDATDCGISEKDLTGLELLVQMAMLPGPSTKHAHVVLPSASWAEKRGSMINIKGRLQRLNRAIASPGQARDDWEILRDLIAIVDPSQPKPMLIEDVFAEMAATHPALDGLTLSKIGDLGIQLPASALTQGQSVPVQLSGAPTFQA